MAYYLAFDGTSNKVELPSGLTLSNAGNYIEFDVEFTAGDNTQFIFGNKSNSFDQFLIYDTTRWRLRVFSGIAELFIPLPTGRTLLRFERTASGYELFYDGVSQGTFSQPAGFSPTLVGSWAGGNAFADIALYTLVRGTSSSILNDYNKQTLNGSNDTTLPDTVGGNDGTLVNFPADDSQWIFYDDGGGAVEQPVVSVNAEEVHQANTLSISAFNSVSSVIAEQVESANIIDVFLSQLTSSIQAQERHDATALNIEQSAAQSVNSLTAEQIEQANLIGISQSLPVNSVQAQENQQANTLTIEQSAGQSIILNTAQQAEQATVLSLAQQQALAHIVAEQLSAASVTDVSTLQAVTMIIAKESHQASTLNVEQYTGQLVTLITAEQKNEAQTLLISEVSAIDVLQAEQFTNAETMAFSQVQRLTQITAEQLTEAQLLTILTSGDNTDLSGLRLIPVTSKYTINPTNTTRYSLQKV